MPLLLRVDNVIAILCGSGIEVKKFTIHAHLEAQMHAHGFSLSIINENGLQQKALHCVSVAKYET